MEVGKKGGFEENDDGDGVEKGISPDGFNLETDNPEEINIIVGLM